MAPEQEGMDWQQDKYDGIPPLYIAVTADEYELPVAVFDNIRDLSRWAQTSTSAAYNAITRRTARKKGPAAGCRFIRLPNVIERRKEHERKAETDQRNRAEI